MEKAVLKIDLTALNKFVDNFDTSYERIKEQCKDDSLKMTEVIFTHHGIVELYCWLISNAKFEIEKGDEDGIQ